MPGDVSNNQATPYALSATLPWTSKHTFCALVVRNGPVLVQTPCENDTPRYIRAFPLPATVDSPIFVYNTEAGYTGPASSATDREDKPEWRIAMRKVTKVLIGLGLLICATGIAMADTVVKEEVSKDAVQIQGMSQPARTDTLTTWISDTHVCASSTTGSRTLVDLESGEMVLIYADRRIFVKLPTNFNDLKSFLKSDGSSADDSMAAAPESPQLSNAPKLQMTVKRVDETKPVGEWMADKYEMKLTTAMGGSTTTIWASKDKEFPSLQYMAGTQAKLTMFPGYEENFAELMKIEGVPVASEVTVTMMGATQKTHTRLLQFDSADPPEGIYEVPEGFTEEDFMSAMRGGGR